MINSKLNSSSNSVTGSRNIAKWVAKTGILASVAILLMFLEMVIPLMPAFLKFDFSEIAVLLAAFSLGPWTADLVELIKNLAHLPMTGTSGVGELANFLVGSAFVLTAGLYYRRHKNRKGAFIAMGLGTVVMTVVASFLNYYFIVPFYVNVQGWPMDALVEMSNLAGNKLVTDIESLITFVFVPFNIFKGVVISAIVALLYKRLSPLLHK